MTEHSDNVSIPFRFVVAVGLSLVLVGPLASVIYVAFVPDVVELLRFQVVVSSLAIVAISGCVLAIVIFLRQLTSIVHGRAKRSLFSELRVLQDWLEGRAGIDGEQSAADEAELSFVRHIIECATVGAILEVLCEEGHRVYVDQSLSALAVVGDSAIFPLGDGTALRWPTSGCRVSTDIVERQSGLLKAYIRLIDSDSRRIVKEAELGRYAYKASALSILADQLKTVTSIETVLEISSVWLQRVMPAWNGEIKSGGSGIALGVEDYSLTFTDLRLLFPEDGQFIKVAACVIREALYRAGPQNRVALFESESVSEVVRPYVLPDGMAKFLDDVSAQLEGIQEVGLDVALVMDALELEQLRTGRIVSRKQCIRLEDIPEYWSSALSGSVRDGVQLSVSGQGLPETIWGEGEVIQKIGERMISHALTKTYQGYVTCVFGQDAGELVLRVESSDLIDFASGGNAERLSVDGLGLAIARSYVELLGGMMGCQPKETGSVIWARWPIDKKVCE